MVLSITRPPPRVFAIDKRLKPENNVHIILLINQQPTLIHRTRGHYGHKTHIQVFAPNTFFVHSWCQLNSPTKSYLHDLHPRSLFGRRVTRLDVSAAIFSICLNRGESPRRPFFMLATCGESAPA